MVFRTVSIQLVMAVCIVLQAIPSLPCICRASDGADGGQPLTAAASCPGTSDETTRCVVCAAEYETKRSADRRSDDRPSRPWQAALFAIPLQQDDTDVSCSVAFSPCELPSVDLATLQVFLE